MSTDFLDDFEVVDPTAVEALGPTYPVAQWLNGDPKMAAAGGVAHTGGIILPLKYLGDAVTPAPGWSKTTVAFSSGKSETVLAAPKVRLAVIRTRFRWFVMQNGVTTYFPRSGYIAESGMRGHVQALCGVAGYDFPLVITFKGKASQEFERLLREFTQKIQDATVHAARSANKPVSHFPRFAFYMKLAAGPHIKAGPKGQDAIITPPVLELPQELNGDYLNKIYVGRESLAAFQQIFHESVEWSAQWDRPGAEDTVEEHEYAPAAPELSAF